MIKKTQKTLQQSGKTQENTEKNEEKCYVCQEKNRKNEWKRVKMSKNELFARVRVINNPNKPEKTTPSKIFFA